MSLAEYKALVAEAAGPLKQRLLVIEEDMAALREEKVEIEQILRKTDQLPKRNGKPKTVASTVNPETLDRFYTKLLTGLDVGALFWASMLEQDTQFNFISRSHITKALGQLHEQGRIALHSKGIGGRRNYTVVR